MNKESCSGRARISVLKWIWVRHRVLSMQWFFRWNFDELCVCVKHLTRCKTSTWWCWLSSLIGFSVRYSTADLVNCLSVSFQNRKQGAWGFSTGLGQRRRLLRSVKSFWDARVTYLPQFHFILHRLAEMGCGQPKNHHAVSKQSVFNFLVSHGFRSLSRWDRFGLQ